MQERWKTPLFFFGALACLFAAWLLVSRFSGRWGESEPTTVAGAALTFDASRMAEGSRDSSAPLPEDAPSQLWIVYVTGGVRFPGVYRVEPGSRVYVAVEKAGGFSPEGDPEAVNLAASLTDGLHLHVPRKGEVPSPSAAPGARAPSASAVLGRGEARIDVNRAGTAELTTLPGIGPKLSEAIVADREAKGPFRSVDDLRRVRGIGSAKLEAIRELVTAGP